MSEKITKFTMEDVRCFAGRQTLEIRPLTFLIGENSTGKSSALGCFHVLAKCLSSRPESQLDFNMDPYSMGSFRDIVTKKRPLCDQFKLSVELDDDEIKAFSIVLAERRQGAEPVIEQVEIVFVNGKICFQQRSRARENRYKNRLQIDIEKTEIEKNIFYIFHENDEIDFSPLLLYSRLGYIYFRKEEVASPAEKEAEEAEEALARFLKKRRGLYFMKNKLFSFAPFRSRPKRTYDPIREFEDPEGSDIPFFLMRMKASQGDKWKALQERLIEFGKASGLFEGIEVKRHGKTTSDPFQIQIKVRGPKSNIMDVGYGVSQVLPILVRILNFRRHRFLMQQPEVHLHPRGQAELTSLFVETIKRNKNTFIIETHSDYMIDRARIEIMKGNIKPDDVSLIYLEPMKAKAHKAHVEVHNIGFTKEGNLTDVPNSYREFFLKETDRLLGFGD